MSALSKNEKHGGSGRKGNGTIAEAAFDQDDTWPEFLHALTRLLDIRYAALPPWEGPANTAATDAPVAVLADSSSGDQADKLRLDGFNCVHGFAFLPSVTGTRWLTPVGNSRSALAGLEIYRPYARPARLFTKLLQAVTRAGWLGWARHRVLIGSKSALSLQVLATKVTGEHHPVFSMSLGTPGHFRKLTVQVMRPSGEILGYAKLPLTEAASECLRHEAAVLKDLANFPSLRPHIPKVLHAGAWGNGHILFVSGGPAQEGPVELGPAHENFLRTLRSAQSLEKPGSFIVEKVAARWRKASSEVNSELRELGKRALAKAGRELGGAKLRCGISHGDFAPWNTRVGDGRLFVFDWECADWEAPSQWDAFHFNIQVTSLLNKGRNGHVRLESPAERASFLLYLLSSICQFTEEKVWENHPGVEYRQKLLSAAL